MTFKKLMKEANKIPPSSFKVGPKVKIQPPPRLGEKPRPQEKKWTPPLTSSPSVPFAKALPNRPVPLKPTSPRPQKSLADRVLPSTTRSVSPASRPKVNKPSPIPQRKPAIPNTPVSTKSTAQTGSSAKDAKSKLRDSFVPGDLIPLAQGPKRDLRTIEEIQNDLWRKKGKSYPSITGIQKDTRPRPQTPTTASAKKEPVPARKPDVAPRKIAPTPKKRRRQIGRAHV